jgi:hypothetical protein
MSLSFQVVHLQNSTMHPPATAVLGSQHAQGHRPKGKWHTSDFSRCSYHSTCKSAAGSSTHATSVTAQSYHPTVPLRCNCCFLSGERTLAASC